MASRYDCRRSAATCAMTSIQLDPSIDRSFCPGHSKIRLIQIRLESLQVHSLQDPRLRWYRTNLGSPEELVPRGRGDYTPAHICTWRFVGITHGGISLSLPREYMLECPGKHSGDFAKSSAYGEPMTVLLSSSSLDSAFGHPASCRHSWHERSFKSPLPRRSAGCSGAPADLS